MKKNNRYEFLSPEILDQAVVDITEIARESGVRLVLVGGYAMQLYGSPRLTANVDVAALEMLESLEPEQELSFGGAQVRAPNGVPVDIIVRDDEYAPLYSKAIKTAKYVQEAPLSVVGPEYLAAMKMAAGRRGKNDADLEFLVAAEVVDIAKARRVIQKFLGIYAAREFDQLVRVVHWKRGTPGPDGAESR